MRTHNPSTFSLLVVIIAFLFLGNVAGCSKSNQRKKFPGESFKVADVTLKYVAPIEIYQDGAVRSVEEIDLESIVHSDEVMGPIVRDYLAAFRHVSGKRLSENDAIEYLRKRVWVTKLKKSPGEYSVRVWSKNAFFASSILRRVREGTVKRLTDRLVIKVFGAKIQKASERRSELQAELKEFDDLVIFTSQQTKRQKEIRKEIGTINRKIRGNTTNLTGGVANLKSAGVKWGWKVSRPPSFVPEKICLEYDELRSLSPRLPGHNYQLQR